MNKLQKIAHDSRLAADVAIVASVTIANQSSDSLLEYLKASADSDSDTIAKAVLAYPSLVNHLTAKKINAELVNASPGFMGILKALANLKKDKSLPPVTPDDVRDAIDVGHEEQERPSLTWDDVTHGTVFGGLRN